MLSENKFSSQGSPSPQPSPQEGEGGPQKPKAFGYVSRREFLKLGMTAAAGVAVGQTVRFLPGGVSTFDEMVTPHRNVLDEWVSSHCSLCPVHCPILARKVGNRVVGVVQDRALPSSPQVVCPKAFALPQEMYHPDRLKTPLERQGSGAGAPFSPLSWEKAVQRIQGALFGKGKPGPWCLVADSQNIMISQGLWEYAAGRYAAHPEGVEPVYHAEWTPNQGPVDMLQKMVGENEIELFYDLERSESVLSLGMDWMQTFFHPALAQKAFGLLNQEGGRDRRNPRTVTVSSCLTHTAMKSKVWFPCQAGAEGWSTWLLIALLIKDPEWLSWSPMGHFPGGEEIVERVRSVCSIPDLIQRTGLSSEKALWLERWLKDGVQRGKPALVLSPRAGLLEQAGSVLLHLLLGTINKPGGLFIRPAFSWNSVFGGMGLSQRVGAGFKPAPTMKSPARAEDLPDQILSGSYRPETVVLYGVNPCFTSPEPERWRKALSRVPFVISFSSFLDETASLSHLVLPPSLLGEGEELVVFPTSTSGSRSARFLTPSVSFPRSEVRRGGRRESSSVSSPDVGWSLGEIALKAAPGLLGGIDFATAVRKMEPAVQTYLEKLSGKTYPIQNLNPCRDELNQLKTVLESEVQAAPAEAKNQFHLQVRYPLSFSYGYGSHLPYLLTTLNPYSRQEWETFVEINPVSARRRGLSDLQKIRVSSSTGQIRATLHVSNFVPENILSIPFGLGHTRMDHYAKGIGSNPMELISYPSHGLLPPILSGEKVTIEPA